MLFTDEMIRRYDRIFCSRQSFLNRKERGQQNMLIIDSLLSGS